MTPTNMTELLHSGLMNDSEPEVFPLKHSAHGITFPVLYLKIMPLSAHGANFNFSVWFVELLGIADTKVCVSVCVCDGGRDVGMWVYLCMLVEM